MFLQFFEKNLDNFSIPDYVVLLNVSDVAKKRDQFLIEALVGWILDVFSVNVSLVELLIFKEM